MSFLELAHLDIEYEKGTPVLQDFNLSVEKGEFLSLLGPSGCGKTTMLRTIAGFIEPSKGRVRVGDRDYTRRLPHQRNIGLVFQSYALFPHLSVFDNVAFGLKMRRVKPDAVKKRVEAALSMVDLAGLERRLPTQLSGGQRQRVALARALVIEPDLLLLDEPLSNLDAKLRVGMRAELHKLQRQLGITAVYVTHDQIEALSLSDRIVVMNKGRIEQMGKPEEIYYRPATPFVAQFMGFDNRLRASVRSVRGQQVEVEAGAVCLRANLYADFDVKAGDPVEVLFRPETASLQKEDGANTIPGEIVFRNFQGNVAQYLIRTDLGEFTVSVAENAPTFAEGPIHIAVTPTNLVVTRYKGET